MRARIELLLKQQKLTKKDVRDILQVYAFRLFSLLKFVGEVSLLD
jgi:hypothetical protein